jgi:hypothetical protein
VGYRRVPVPLQGRRGVHVHGPGRTTTNSRSAPTRSEDIIPYLIEGGEVDALMYEDLPIGIQLKATVEMKVVDTIPGVKGDTATGG